MTTVQLVDRLAAMLELQDYCDSFNARDMARKLVEDLDNAGLRIERKAEPGKAAA